MEKRTLISEYIADHSYLKFAHVWSLLKPEGTKYNHQTGHSEPVYCTPNIILTYFFRNTQKPCIYFYIKRNERLLQKQKGEKGEREGENEENQKGENHHRSYSHGINMATAALAKRQRILL